MRALNDSPVVHLDRGTSLEGALRALKRQLRDARLGQELKRRESFTPRAVLRRRKAHRARQRARRDAARA